MINELLQTTFIISILAGTIRVATPLLLGALGELITERAGVINLGIEGTMLMGAFCGFWGASISGSLAVGIGFAILAGGIMALITAFMTVTLKVNQVVTGLASNLLGSGVSFYAYRIIFKNAISGDFPRIEIFHSLDIPLLSDIPILGDVLFSQYLLSYVSFLLVPLIAWFLYRTKYGLRIRTVGENPRVIDMRGLSVSKLRYGAVVFGGLLMGLGGSFLTLASTGLFLPDMTGGRGWLAYVIVIAGNWLPGRVMGMALLFALLDSIQLHLQGMGIEFPFQVLLALPYVFAIVATVLSRMRSGMPASLGEPYLRS